MTEIITENVNSKTTDIDLCSSSEIVKLINDEDKQVAFAVEEVLPEIAEAVDLISKQFLKGGRLLYFGAGTSGRLGILDASECPPTFSTDKDMVQGFIAGGDLALRTAVEGAEDNFDFGYADAQIADKNDVITLISASGNPKYLQGVFAWAKEKNINTIGVTCNKNGFVAQNADVVICAEVDAEVIAGSSRMKAGTAQKMILNMLTTASMIKIGKTYKNLMIDLKPTNEKLKDRAIRIVSAIADVPYSRALEVLLDTNWEIKTSIVSIIKSVDKEIARKELRKFGGILRKVLREKIEV
ncbi:N-acetylmuramic acid 6-phosphate etherase [bacterium]|nr:N-acetylmuramic acid 6-phosphate etherase [bacterium]